MGFLAGGIRVLDDFNEMVDRVNVSASYRLEVSGRLREYGRSYYPLHGSELHMPRRPEHRPDRELLAWHNQTVYRG
jgi:putative restriction endonuclease